MTLNHEPKEGTIPLENWKCAKCFIICNVFSFAFQSIFTICSVSICIHKFIQFDSFTTLHSIPNSPFYCLLFIQQCQCYPAACKWNVLFLSLPGFHSHKYFHLPSLPQTQIPPKAFKIHEIFNRREELRTCHVERKKKGKKFCCILSVIFLPSAFRDDWILQQYKYSLLTCPLPRGCCIFLALPQSSQVHLGSRTGYHDLV